MTWKPTQSIWDEAERKAQERLRKEFGQYLRNDGAAESTVDALMYSLRRGLSALGPSDPLQKDTLRRLSELNKEQLKDCCDRLQKRKPPIGQAWTANEIAELISVWGKVRR